MYKIGKVVIDINQPKNFESITKLEPFISSNEDIDVRYDLCFVDKLPILSDEKCIHFTQQLAIEKLDNHYRYFHALGNGLYAVVDECGDKYTVYLQENSFDNYPYFIPSLLGLERALIKKDSFVLHSSNVSYDNKAILFTAPSGGGKSTQADLWMKYKDADIINGDRNIIGLDDEKWYTYGTPFSGSSPYCVNKTVSLGAIVILEKGPVNEIRRLDMRGFNHIFSQITVNPWDKDFCNKIMDLIMKVCHDIPVYIYSCTKEESAVNDLYDTLVKDGVIDGNNE